MPHDPSPNESRLETRPSHDSGSFAAFRKNVDAAAEQEVPRLHPVLLVGMIAGLVVSIGLTFAPWFRYEREDGSVEYANGIRTDGLVLVIAAVVAIVMFVAASRQQPGDGDFQALIGFGATLVGLGAVLFTVMDPNVVLVDDPGTLVSTSRAWGLVAATVVMLLTSLGAFRLWRTASYY